MSERWVGILIGAGLVALLTLIGLGVLWWTLIRWEQRR